MNLTFRKFVISSFALVLVLSSLSACSKPDQASGSSVPVSSAAPSSAASSSQPESVEGASSAASSDAGSQASSSQPDDAQKAMLLSMQKEAQQGRVLNIEFAAKTSMIDDVQGKWGKEDKSEYIADAKGTYDTFSKHNAVFGYNKGAQIFEVRSLDSALKALTLSQVKAAYGEPAYDKKSSTEEIIGYVINSDFKMLLVFPAGSGDPKLDHYSVFYPAGTVNSMADDPGRQW
jgi:hypothetical protein